MRKTDIFKKIIFILFFIISVISFQKSININNNESYIEVIRKVDSEEEAYFLASQYNLTLIDISPYNIVKYQTNENELNKILNEGFYINNSFSPAYTPTDPYYNYQNEITDTKINQVWNYTLGDGVVVAIIDTGIVASNLEFKNSISTLSYNSVTRTVGISEVTDDDGHGTSVASILAANHNNRNAMAGVAPNVELMVIKTNTLNLENESRFSENDIIDAIYYAVDNNADIINMSLGGEGYNQLTQDAINYAYENQVIVVAAAGNEGNDSIIYPASYNNVVSVAAADDNKEIASFSVYNEYVDISAPGVDIVNITMNNDVVIGSGTSFAAPIVSGVLALYKSVYPNEDIEKLINKLYSSAIDINEVGKDIYSGYGYIDAYSGYIYDLYKVTFLNYDDSVLNEQYVVSGDSATYNIIPVKPDTEGYSYNFIGWDTDFSVVSSDLVVKPNFSPVIKSFTYSFLNDDNTVIKEQTANYNSIIIPPPNPEKNSTEIYDYLFLGWSPTFVDGTLLKGDVLYKAVYEQRLREFTISYFDSFDNLVKEERVIYGNSANVFSLNSYQDEQYDYIFSNWDKDLSYITSDLIVRPVFEKQTRTFIVNYYDYFGDFIDGEIVEYGSSASMTSIDISYDDVYKYEFISWDKDYSSIISDLNLYPLFSKEYRQFSVNFYDYFGELYKNDLVIYSGSAENFELDVDYDEEFEYYFTKWDKDFSNVIEDMEIYPVFYKVQREFEISFVMRDNVVNQKVVYGMMPVMDFDTTIIGFDFMGWDKEITNTYQNETYIAIYNVKTFVVRFMDEDTLIDEMIVEYGDSIDSLPSVPQKEGYDSYFEDIDLNNIKEDLIVNVYYKIKKLLVIITLDGKEIERKNINYGDSLEVYPKVDEKTGYKFIYPQELPFVIKENYTLDIVSQKNIFKISYLDKLGLVFRTDDVLYGEIPTEYIMNDDKFIGWYLDDQLFDFGKPIYEDIVLSPKYKSFGCGTNIAYVWFALFALSFLIIRKRKI